MPAKVKLEVTDGPIRGQVFLFEQHDTFIFGRAEDCHARLSHDDSTASRHHFILEVNPPDARIRDLGSLNGTYVNEVKYGGREKNETPEEAAKRKFPEVDIRNGDKIEVGNTVFSVLVEIPTSCCQCGIGIPEAFKSVCKWEGNEFVCPQCREKIQKSGQKLEPPRPMRCNKCGKDVSAEVGGRRHGDYICQECQGSAFSDPAALIGSMLKNASAPGGLLEIADYEIGKRLACGGMGCVYLARRKKDGATVALKVMLAKVAVREDARQRFLREIDVMCGLRHTNIVELTDHGSAGVGFYFVMGFCPGGNVHDHMERRGGKLPLREAASIVLQSLEGLSYAHDKGFVHRDLKPQNILLSAPRDGIAKVADFGLAKYFDLSGLSGMTATGTAAGTPEFMPREQLTNFKYVKPVSDVWSMGATLYYMLTGRTPRDFPRGRDPMEVILHGEIVPIRKRDPGIPSNVAEVIDHAVADKAKERYQSAGEFRDALVKVL